MPHSSAESTPYVSEPQVETFYDDFASWWAPVSKNQSNLGNNGRTTAGCQNFGGFQAV